MTLFNMAFKNIRRNFNNYLIYFVSMVFSIMIFHVFTSIQYNQQIAELQDVKTSIMVTFKSSSVIIAIFAGIFIWYSNSFFIKKRKKEVALYSLMGVRKKQIGRMLFYENILMGVLALGTGILLGSLLTKFFVMLLLQLMGFNLAVNFVIQLRPMKDTAIMFSILFLITSIHGYTIIYRFKLIDLFKAENTAQKAPKASWIKALLSLVLILGGYYYYLGSKRINPLIPFITLALVVAGTYLLFSSLTVYLIKLAKRNKGRYYKGTSLISTSQLMYRLKGHARTLATIAVLSATTLTAMGVTTSYYYDFQMNLNERQPFSYVFVSEKEGLDKAVDAVIAKYPEHAVINEVNFEMLRVKSTLPDLGFQNNLNRTIRVMSESGYNTLAKARGLKESVYLDYYKDILFIDTYYTKDFMQPYTDKELKLKFDGETHSFHIKSFHSRFILNAAMADYIAVVDDDVYKEISSKEQKLWGKAYKVNNQKDSEALSEEVYQTLEGLGMDMKGWPRPIGSYYMQYRGELLASGLTIFIGAFLGLVFLMATGSIIFFKQLSEANEDKKRYQVLQNIGFGKKDIKNIISRQMLFVFMLPLSVGVVHSVVAVYILKKILNMNIFIPLTITVAAYTLIYMIYYLLTVKSYNKLVNNEI